MQGFDVFTSDVFSLRSMTDAINLQPYTPGQIGMLGLFEDRRVATTTVQIEEKAGLLSLVQTTLYGAPAIQSTRENRKMRSFGVPHLALEDTILASEIMNVREFGSTDALQALESVRNDRLAIMARNMDVTLENLRLGALKGTILDADGTTTIYNLFTEFGVSQVAEYAFDLSNSSAEPMKTANQIVRSIQDELGDASTMMDHVHALVSPTFMDAFVTNKAVKESYQRFTAVASVGQVGAFLRESYVRKPAFPWGGIMWEEYRGASSGPAITTDKAIFFPVGVPGLFPNYWAPADFAETVNTLGLPRYAKAAPDPVMNRWIKVHTQSNPLPLCTRPRTLQIGRMGA